MTGTGWCRLRDEGDYVRLILASGSPGMCVVPRSEWESWPTRPEMATDRLARYGYRLTSTASPPLFDPEDGDHE